MSRKRDCADCVKVLCRFRPMNSLEKKKRSTRNFEKIDDKSIVFFNPHGKLDFDFDYVFEEDSTQTEIFDLVGVKCVDELFKGFNGTIFAYGQTGSGKTFTMMGPNENHSGYCEDINFKGVIPRIVENIFDRIEQTQEEKEFMIQVSYIEIYMEKVRDLLYEKKKKKKRGSQRERSRINQKNLRILEDKTKGGKGIYVEGATNVYCDSVDEVFEYMKKGSSKRETGSHKMNKDSSRSHSVFMLKLIQKDLTEGSTSTGKLYLIDLAGSESIKKTDAIGSLRDEAKEINKSLTFLGIVIHKLTDGKSKHVPYRSSKLTRLLQDSLGGNCKTFLIINCSPASYNQSETLSTLRFGKRAKNIKQKAKRNKLLDAKTLAKMLEKANAKITQQLKYIAMLKEQLLVADRSDSSSDDDVGDGVKVRPKNPKHLLVDELKLKNEKLKGEITERETVIISNKVDKEKMITRLKVAVEKLGKREKFVVNLEKELREHPGGDLKGKNLRLEDDVNKFNTTLQKMEYSKQEQRITIETLKNSLERMNKQLQKSKSKESKRGPRRPSLQMAQHDIKTVGEHLKSLTIGGFPQVVSQMCSDNREFIRKRRLSESESAFSLAQKNAANTNTNTNTGSLQVDEMINHRRNSKKILDMNMKVVTKLSKKREDVLEKIRIVEEQVQIATSNSQKEIAHMEKQRFALVRDFKNRCDRVVYLEMALEDLRENYQHVLSVSENRDLSGEAVELETKIREREEDEKNLEKENEGIRETIRVSMEKLKLRNNRTQQLEEHLETVLGESNDQTTKHIRDRDQLLKQNGSNKEEIESLKMVIEQLQLENDSSRYRRGGRKVSKPKTVWRGKHKKIMKMKKKKNPIYSDLSVVIRKSKVRIKDKNRLTPILREKIQSLEMFNLRGKREKSPITPEKKRNSISDVMNSPSRSLNREKNNRRRYTLAHFVLDGGQGNLEFSPESQSKKKKESKEETSPGWDFDITQISGGK